MRNNGDEMGLSIHELLDDKEFQADIQNMLEHIQMLCKKHNTLYTFQISDILGIGSIRGISPNMEDFVYKIHFDGYKTEYMSRLDIQDKINSGREVMRCFDDANKPDDFKGDWPVVGEPYIVKNLIVMDDGEIGVLFEGLEIQPPYEAYSLKRFKRVDGNLKNN